MSEMDKRRSMQLARRRSLKAADSVRSLRGTKERPGFEVSQRRKTALDARARASQSIAPASSSSTAAPVASTVPSAASGAEAPTALSLVSVPEQVSTRDHDGGSGAARGGDKEETFSV